MCLGDLGHGWSERPNRQFESSDTREHSPSEEGGPDGGFGVSQVSNNATEIRRKLTTTSSWPLERIEDPGHNRHAIVHNFLDLKPDLVGHDDEIYINTQTSSQWDGLRKYIYCDCTLLRLYFCWLQGHWAHQPTGRNQHFSALVADNMAFEAWPAEGSYRKLISRI